MKKTTLFSLLASLTVAVITSTALAASATDTTKNFNQDSQLITTLQNLKNSGYIAIRKIKLEEGNYKIEAFDVQGQRVNLRIDSQTGKIIKPKSTAVAIGMIEAVKKADAAGYHNISKIEAEDNKYEIKALDKDGKKGSIKIDAYTGELTDKD